MKLRFSIRAILVTMTLFALFLGYHLSWIQQRRTAIASGSINLEEDAFAPSLRLGPGLLWMFGERGYEYIELKGGVNQVEAERFKGIFPEANIYWINPPGIRVPP